MPAPARKRDLPKIPGERAAAQHVRRGRLVERIFLTGTVEAKKAVTITAPRVPGGQLQIRWMAEDGAFVRKGQKVLEFANAAFAADLEDKKLSASKAQKELLKLESQTKAETAEKAFAVEQQKTEMAFLVESFSISLMGGSAGVLMGLAIAYIVAYYAGWPTLVTL